MAKSSAKKPAAKKPAFAKKPLPGPASAKAAKWEKTKADKLEDRKARG